MKVLNFLFLNMAMILGAASAVAKIDPSSLPPIREGVYVSAANAERACTVIVENKSLLLNSDRFTVRVAQRSGAIYKDDGDFAFFDETSDVFSLEELKKQVVENDGNFLIVTKNTSSTTNQVSGTLYEQDGGAFLKINVSKNSCFGICTGGATTCTVQLR